MPAHGPKFYILGDDGRTPVPCDVLTWGRRFETADRNVAITERGGMQVSTVFIGLDHGLGNRPPRLFETMVFEGGKSRYRYTNHYATWDEAEAGHRDICLMVFGPAG